MLRVFIVDDESVIRIGFRHLDWQQYGCELVGDASNGLDALGQVAQLKPDVIISDICMPQMDGLEFSRLVKRMDPQCSIILLTGYDEFAYAQQALNIGVDFLLMKPTNFDELASMLRRINDRRHQQQRLSVATGSLSSLIQGNLLRELLLGRTLQGDAAYLFKRNEHSFRQFCILCLLPAPPAVPSELNELRAILSETCLMAAEENGMDMIYTDTDDAVVCMLRIPEEKTDAWQSHVKLYVQDALSRLQSYHHLDMICGSSRMHATDEVQTAYHEALQALNGCFLLHAPSHLYEDNEACAFSLQQLSDWKEQLSGYLFSGCLEGVRESFDQLLTLLEPQGLCKSWEACSRVRMMLHTFVWETAHKLKASASSEAQPLDAAIQEFLHSAISATLPGVYGMVRKQVLQMTQALRETMRMQTAAAFVTYIQEHFQDADLSLETLAETFGLSPSHMSRMIKRETGASFVEHLTGFRIARAKNLLADSNLTLSEIASEVGFRDMSYFIHVFKRHVGLTPNTYRKLHNVS